MEKLKNNKILMNEGIRVAEISFCLLCENKGEQLYTDLRDYLFNAPGKWMLLRCPKCNLVWLNPQPIPEDTEKIYHNYFTHNPAPEIINNEPINSWRNKIKISVLNVAFGYKNNSANKILGWLASRVSPLRDIIGEEIMWLNGSCPGKLLDIGCGNGKFLATMHKLGWEVTGVEPDGEAVKVAQQRFGLNVHEGDLEEIGFPDDIFDAITMHHVVEHLPDPIGTLRECRRILKKGGRLIIIIPNIESLGHSLYREAWRGLEPPRHLFLFSPSTLRVCVERSGLHVLEQFSTVRMARWVSAESRLIKRNNMLLPDASTQKQGILPILKGITFQAVEYGLCWVSDVGEEIVLIVSK